MININVGNSEILQIVDAVSREKDIDKEKVISAMEQAIQVAGRRKYGQKHNIKAEIDRKTGEIKLYRVFTVVENIENPNAEILLPDALESDPESKLGSNILELLPPIDLGRVAAQAAKQVVVQKVKDAVKDRQYFEYVDRAGEIISGVVKRIEFGNVILELGRGDEAILEKNSIIEGESFRQNDRVRAYIAEVRRNNKGPQIFLSRTNDQFLAKLFTQEVPEIYDGTIEIKSVARDPGSRAKIAVYCGDPSVDAVGSCVGVRGSRVQSVIAELKGEKIDIIEWSSDHATFVLNALSPATVSKVVIDEDSKRIEAVVPNDQLSLAIGKRGQNVRLASKLTRWNIDVLTEDEESKRRVDEFNNATNLFIKALDVEEVIAQLLAAEGYLSIEDISFVDLQELASIEGFDSDIALELQNRAKSYLDSENKSYNEKIVSLGIDSKLLELLNLNPEKIVKLGENGIKTLEDLAELSVKEFVELLPNSGYSREKIRDLINFANESGKDL
jgi:transcription termination/antitermination protein NusA